MKAKRFLGFALAGLLLVALGCSAAPTATPVPRRVGVSAPGTPVPEEPVDEGLDDNLAVVDQFEIVIKESLPVQVALQIEGHLPDGCTHLDLITQEVQGDRILVRVVTTRDDDAMCIMALVPFEYEFPLDLSGLEPGTYTVDVNGVEQEFVLEEAMLAPVVEEYEEAEAQIEDVQLKMTRSIPAKVIASIRGYLPGGCAELGDVTQTIEGDRIRIRVMTLTPVGVPCTMALVGFLEEVPLELEGVEPGTYTVDVNGVETELVWEGAMTGSQVDGEAYQYGDALVDSVEVLVMESMPVQVALVIEGHFRDGCTSLSEITQAVRGDRIVIRLVTRRPKDAMCTQALVPFTERYQLDLSDVEPGTYKLQVNNITETLTLDAAMLGE